MLHGPKTQDYYFFLVVEMQFKGDLCMVCSKAITAVKSNAYILI